MSSVIDYKRCPRCSGVVYTEFNWRTGEEYSICERCGISYGLEDDNESFGRCCIRFKNGIGRSFSLAEPVDNKIKAWYEEQMKNEEVDSDKSYLVAWNPDEEEVKVIFGTDPGLYEDES